jgi:type IV pilus assembly protein PilC
MKTYLYRAESTDGSVAKGIVNAVDEYQAAVQVRQQYPIILSIKEQKKQSSFLSQELGTDRIDIKSLSVACSQVAITLRSGIPLARCMELIGNQTANKNIRRIFQETAEDVAGGNGLADSFERNGPKLPVTFIETVRAGEETGNIEQSFQSMADYYDRLNKTRQKVRQALIYPTFVLVVAVVVLIIVMVFVIPSLANAFTDLGGNLPVLTKMLIAMSNFFAKWWALVAIVVAAAVLAWRFYVQTPKGREVQGKAQLNMPILGNIRRMDGAAHFASTMAMLVRAGITVNRAVEITGNTLDNYIMQCQVAKVPERLEEGHSLGDSLKDCDSFPQNLLEMCAIGEESGDLDQTLQVIGDFYANETDNATKQALAKLDPIILIVLAVFTGFIVISIYLPMFTIYNYM